MCLYKPLLRDNESLPEYMNLNTSGTITLLTHRCVFISIRHLLERSDEAIMVQTKGLHITTLYSQHYWLYNTLMGL